MGGKLRNGSSINYNRLGLNSMAIRRVQVDGEKKKKIGKSAHYDWLVDFVLSPLVGTSSSVVGGRILPYSPLVDFPVGVACDTYMGKVENSFLLFGCSFPSPQFSLIRPRWEERAKRQFGDSL